MWSNGICTHCWWEFKLIWPLWKPQGPYVLKLSKHLTTQQFHLSTVQYSDSILVHTQQKCMWRAGNFLLLVRVLVTWECLVCENSSSLHVNFSVYIILQVFKCYVEILGSFINGSLLMSIFYSGQARQLWKINTFLQRRKLSDGYLGPLWAISAISCDSTIISIKRKAL